MEKPSIILPKKRLRGVEMKPGIVVKVSGMNVVKKLSDGEKEKIDGFARRLPGEFYKVEYWREALGRGLEVDACAESLRLVWMDMQRDKESGKATEFWLRVAERKGEGMKEVEGEEGGEREDVIVLWNDGNRKVFNKKSVAEKFSSEGYPKKFENLLKTSNKLSKKQYTPLDLAKLLSQFKGKSIDVLNFIINQSSPTQIQSIYEDCCNLSHTQIPYPSFLSKYISLNGAVTSIYNHYAYKSTN